MNTTLNVVPLALHPTPPATLHAAFSVLCKALEGELQATEQCETLGHVLDIQGWHANGNVVIAWQHAVRILAEVLGAPMG